LVFSERERERERQDSDGGGGVTDVYAACSGGVVYCCFGKIWRIVPCVYKIYTLGRFHGLLGTFLFAVGRGNVYREEEVCISVIVTRVAGVLCTVQ